MAILDILQLIFIAAVVLIGVGTMIFVVKRG